MLLPADGDLGWDGQPRPPYIDEVRPGPAGRVILLPVIHATPRAAIALIETRRYLTARPHQ
ncbi:hypothetical protein NOVA_27280 [Nocardia nova]|uniref:hypothetical protein n=1 Tax=Nocardia nova TaxID=37330 RepID=UPI001C493B4C|nr:hypothetical protein [Nocardia nova]MBV7706494.1 hypothetical protein [Nocardia nova]